MGLERFASWRALHAIQRGAGGGVGGAAELAIAAGLALPLTRRLAGLAASALYIAVFPAHIKMAVDYRKEGKPAAAQALAYARLPLQIPLIRGAWRVFRGK